jgi:hypothetical protein
MMVILECVLCTKLDFYVFIFHVLNSLLVLACTSRTLYDLNCVYLYVVSVFVFQCMVVRYGLTVSV